MGRLSMDKQLVYKPVQPLVYMDLESFNEEPISNGSHKYAETAEILLWGYAIGDAPAKVWDCTAEPEMPEDLAEALQMCRDGRAMSVWHNGMNFDSVVLEHCGYGIPVESVIDTMVIAYQHGLPGALGDLCDIFGLAKDVAKDKDGRRLVQLFCKPRPANCKLRRATRISHPEDWARFVNYCRLDVEAERELYRRLPKINCTPHERALQLLDAKINRRGMLMDVELAKAAIDCSEEVKDDLKRRTREQTRGQVDSANQRDALLDYMRTEYGVDLPTLTKAEVEKRVQDDSIPEPVRELLALRLLTAKNSVQKFKAIVNAVGQDGRLRGCLQFRGAARTGRFSGRLFQPQNLPRPSLSNDEIDCAIQLAKDGFIRDFYDDPMHVLSNCLRGEIIAPEGKKLVVADYSNVEGRVLAWLAGEEWKIKAFKDFDAGHGHDLYKLTYGRTFNVAPEKVTKKQRQMGKVLELALGYGGGAGAFVTFARGYGIDLHDMAKAVRGSIDPSIWREAVDAYDYFVKHDRVVCLDREVFIACDAVKRAWRRANPHITAFWRDLGAAVRAVLACPSHVEQVRNLKVARSATNLLIRLPSGRCLCYPMPRPEDCSSDSFSYLGVNQRTRKWERIESYGAKCVENAVQAVACDLLCDALLRLETAGYETVLTVHDEAITEAPDTDEYNIGEMIRIMTELPQWAKGLPLAAAGFESYRYRKD